MKTLTLTVEQIKDIFWTGRWEGQRGGGYSDSDFVDALRDTLNQDKPVEQWFSHDDIRKMINE